MKLVLQRGVCDAVTGYLGIWGFNFFAGTFLLYWMRRSVRGFSYCLFPIAYSLLPWRQPDKSVFVQLQLLYQK